MIWYIRQLSHAYMLPSVSQKAISITSEIISQLTRWRLRPFSMHSMLLSMLFLTDNPLDGALGLIYFFVVVVAARVACS